MLLREQLKPGPWDDDLNRHPRIDCVSFDASGYRCTMRRDELDFTYRGYVQLPVTHPDYFRKDLVRLGGGVVPVHGGISHARDGLMGIDFAHYGDLSPILETTGLPSNQHAHYWTYEEAMAETKHMAEEFKRRDTRFRRCLSCLTRCVASDRRLTSLLWRLVD
jgi:hypothetical protein